MCLPKNFINHIFSEIGLILSFKNLKHVYFQIDHPLKGFLDTLNCIAGLNLKISGSISVHGYIDNLARQDKYMFEGAVQILNEKFPGKCEDFSIRGYHMYVKFDGNV